MTNTSTFVGVTARVEARCGCRAKKVYPSCRAEGFIGDEAEECLNGGTCDGGRQCKCPAENPDQFGPQCEKLSASFRLL